MSTTLDKELAEMVETHHNHQDHEIHITRKLIDRIMVGVGLVLTAVLAVAGGLLTWGANFSNDYVTDELSAQHIFFSDRETLIEEGHEDFANWGGTQVDTGPKAEAYSKVIHGHMMNTTGGLTYADLGAVQSEARADLATATEGGDQAAIDEAQAALDKVNGQRDTAFRAEMLRGTLLNAFAWSTVGQIAGIAAIAAFVATGLMAVLTVLGVVHLRRTH